MKAKLLHNPKAGDGSYSRDELIRLVTAQGYQCDYASVKENKWDIFNDALDLVIVAGGDGTVRKVVSKLREKGESYPLAILPLGTANNIGTTLGIKGKPPQLSETWRKNNLQKFDIGNIKGIGSQDFFMESIGCGIFPNLVRKMSMPGVNIPANPEQEIRFAIKKLLEIAANYTPKECRLILDDVDHSGKFLMVEIMNIRAIGPRLEFNPKGNPSDGIFDVLLIPGRDRSALVNFLQRRLAGEDIPFNFDRVEAKKVSLLWKGAYLHIDDKVIRPGKPVKVKLTPDPRAIDFLVMGD